MLQNIRLRPLIPFGLEITPASPEESIAGLTPEYLESQLQEHKLVLLRGFGALEKEEFLRFCESFKTRSLLHWSFGPIMEMHERPDPQNYLFSREKVPFHWDGAFAKVPTYLAFQCVEAPTGGAGGETLFTDTERIWTRASESEKSLYQKASLRYETEKLAHYGGTIEGPLKQLHPEKKTPILRYAEAVQTKLNPVTLQVKNVSHEESQALQQQLQEKIYDSEYCYIHDWQPHDVLIADNHSLIHGRRAFQDGSPRHLRRIQLV